MGDWVGLSRAAVVERLVEVIEAVRCGHPVRVAVDGPDAAGKTTLADELAVELRRGDASWFELLAEIRRDLERRRSEAGAPSDAASGN